MRKIMFAVAGAALLVTPAIALAAPIASPLPIAKISGEIITINHLSEARRGKQVRTRHVRPAVSLSKTSVDGQLCV